MGFGNGAVGFEYIAKKPFRVKKGRGHGKLYDTFILKTKTK
jgi:hypothetical protein